MNFAIVMSPISSMSSRRVLLPIVDFRCHGFYVSRPISTIIRLAQVGVKVFAAMDGRF